MEFEILNPVALLQDLPEHHLLKGQVGTIVELHGNDYYEIEFCDKEGQTIVQLALHKNILLLLHYSLEAA
jgi:hypothetical protein